MYRVREYTTVTYRKALKKKPFTAKAELMFW